ncbi:hypothetical protein AMC99_01478 [Altererythrobacter epoxidivorans]|uniref:MOSC domain-containing protein n=1 Tax=Altererythrobacter epoxidivorans TaxID=361183 RepID=A0A0M4MTT0_9SPHN|nr:MOSC domain-containing protein [Altererythrobacter epoxidivorans]ALE16770.1 hypothetical protein AMC99_01478 [Altererythrobacter epoxidivorans]
MNCIVNAICAGSGRAVPSGKVSGIAKAPLEGQVSIGLRGIEADEQVNRVHHGYPPMALHHYPAENRAWLLEHFGPLPRLAGPGSMGENISTEGLSEHDVHIGDRFRLGTALIEVSQPRQPCSTIESHLDTKGIVKAIVASARSGWFYRVLEPGTASAGDALQKVEEGNPRWPVARAFLAVYGSSRAPESELRELAALDRVSERLVLDIGKRITL